MMNNMKHIDVYKRQGLSINIGNHGAYLFPEFQLGSSYKADYLLLGKSSGGFEFIFVELEDVYKRQVKKIASKEPSGKAGVQPVCGGQARSCLLYTSRCV